MKIIKQFFVAMKDTWNWTDVALACLLIVANLCVFNLILFPEKNELVAAQVFKEPIRVPVVEKPLLQLSPFAEKLSKAAEERTLDQVRYDPAYVRLSYPGGDVAPDTGVCSDVVIRSLRSCGIDLQVLVHEDMKNHFNEYPNIWGLSHPDKNIDHRRVPNLMKFFERRGWSLKINEHSEAYLPGDIVAWEVGRGQTHIGIVSQQWNSNQRFSIVHNIGRGPVLDDFLFQAKIIGHYRMLL